jgi:hypothetical protein
MASHAPASASMRPFANRHFMFFVAKNNFLVFGLFVPLWG